LRKEIGQLQRGMAAKQIDSLVAKAQELDGVKVVAAQVPAANLDALREMGDLLKDKLGPSVVVLGSVIGNKPSFVAMVSPNVQVHAGNLVKQVASVVGGGGGGRPDVAQAGGKDASKIGDALDRARTLVKEALQKDGRADK
ncbi:MAG: DHHA1 domain-containing protein, partial [Chloroflexi bacterium]|nr:DHHA1 domain-containing protein [Chloroflexota bacterium]